MAINLAFNTQTQSNNWLGIQDIDALNTATKVMPT